MGSEASCEAVVNGKRMVGKARLETSTIEFRAAEARFTLGFADLARVSARDGVLALQSKRKPAGSIVTAALTLGPAAQKWADKITHPPSLLAKLGVKPDWRVALIGGVDARFATELQSHVTTLSRGRLLHQADAIFLFLRTAADVERIARLVPCLKPAGAVWTIRRKGAAAVTEASVRAAGLAAGLVDVKVVAFSPTHTAEKFVIPVSARSR